MGIIRRSEDPLWKYMYLMQLQDSNERIFYNVIVNNITELLPIVYTPTVGLACQHFGTIFQSPKGLYITIKD